jgi:hypothetical protein
LPCGLPFQVFPYQKLGIKTSQKKGASMYGTQKGWGDLIQGSTSIFNELETKCIVAATANRGRHRIRKRLDKEPGR